MYSIIVVLLDGSAFSERALPVAVALARQSDAALDLVHVREPAVRAANAPAVDSGIDDAAEQRARARVSSVADTIARETGLAARAVVLRGETVPEVQGYLAERGADLVVLTTHGRGGPRRSRLGRVADALVRAVRAPMLFIRPDADAGPRVPEPHFRRILVPLDQSRRAEDVLPYAVTVGTPADTECLLLHVVTPRAVVSPFPELATMLDAADLAHYVEPARERAAEYLALVANALDEIEVRAAAHTIVHQQVAPAILEFARAQAVDLLILSTRARSMAERRRGSSVADEVLRGASVPVLMCGLDRPDGTVPLGDMAATGSAGTHHIAAHG